MDGAMNDIINRLRRWTHDAVAPPASDLMDEAAAEIERLRGVLATREWVARAEREPDQMRQCLLFTNHLDGFVWIGRRGVLPQDVSHWMYLPEPPRPQP
jgi:hypothetical protein